MNNQRQSWKWDAEAAFKRIEHDSKICAQEPGQGERASRFLHGKQPHRFGWTPAPTKPAYSQTNVNAHLEHKGRDYEALTKAALRKPVGYWEDAPRGAKFGGGEVSAVGAQVARSATGGDAVQLGVSATSNHPAPSSDSDLYEPVGTVPVVGDRLAHPADGGNESYIHDVLTPPRVNTEDMAWVCDDIWCGLGKNGIGWRILKRKQPQVVGARAWRPGNSMGVLTDVVLKFQDGRLFRRLKRNWSVASPSWEFSDVNKDKEIHDPAEVARLVEEVRKAGLLK